MFYREGVSFGYTASLTYSPSFSTRDQIIYFKDSHVDAILPIYYSFDVDEDSETFSSLFIILFILLFSFSSKGKFRRRYMICIFQIAVFVFLEK
jgi:hypothetical protein